MPSTFYAVKRGRSIGIYESWQDCQEQVSGYPGALYKKFNCPHQAQAFINDSNGYVDPSSSSDTEGFVFDANGYLQVYTDGACIRNGQANPQAGVGVWFARNHPLNISRPLVGPATNNNAEIQAARLAIEIARKAGIKKICINTDSDFLIQCVTSWMSGWKRDGWVNAGTTVKNKHELQLLDKELMENVEVVWRKVPAHAGDYGNEMADQLANKGALQY